MTRTKLRGGFTLIELLVAMSIIVTLAGFVALISLNARDQDRVRNAVTEVGGTLKMAQGMAARDKAPRGVRFIVGPDPSNPDKTNVRFVTELQFVELPPPLIGTKTPLSLSTLNPTANPDADARVRFVYTESDGVAPNPPRGTITNRRCFIENLTADQANQVVTGCTVVMPVFGTWHKITGVAAAQEVPAASGRYTKELTLEVYPDANMGGGTAMLTYHFAVYRVAQPLVGEETILLPKEICVDLNVSIGPPPNTTADFDVIFAPDGKLVNAPTGQLFLWVRNYTKPAVYTATPTPTFLTGAPLVDAFRRGGEQHILSVRQSGSHGHAPALWPDMGTGTYTAPQNPYWLARQELNQ